MLNYFRCYLCKDIIHNKKSLLCESCFFISKKREWNSCARCGLINCGGCETLCEFNQVVSLYTYCREFSQILVLAKDNNDYNAQQLFYELFFVPVKNYLLNFILKNENTCFILSPLRKERILNSYWHTNIFFQYILECIKKELKLSQEKFEILSPHMLNKSIKQAIIPVQKRQSKSLEPEDFEINYMCMKDNFKYNFSETRNILLLDDVLTTGKTVLQFKKAIDLLSPQIPCDLFTIFRSPQVKKSNCLN